MFEMVVEVVVVCMYKVVFGVADVVVPILVPPLCW